jgi:hypothetical protein
MPGRGGQRGDDNQKEARARRNAQREARAKAAADKASVVEATPAPTPAEEVAAPVAAPAAKPAPGPIKLGGTLVGAINRSSGDTGKSSLNPAAVSRAKTHGTAIGQIVSSIDGSRARSKVGGIAKKAGASGSSKIIDTSGL